MKYDFKSLFANDMLAYIKLRVSLGNEEDTYARRLHTFDTFCVEQYPEEDILSMEISEAWCTKKPNEKSNTLQLRTSILRGFSKYLLSIGKKAYVIPEGFAGHGIHYIPYLYTDIELSSFFIGADQLPPHPLSPFREYVIPVMFRVLYCCGLRPQEVRYIKVSDTNLEEGTLYISDSKRNKDRVVAMSTELRDLCIKYDAQMQKKLPSREYFFQNPNGGPYRIAWIQQQFFRCWEKAGVSFRKDYKPRVYDWRHNYATRVIVNWMNEQKDIMNLLPYLSTYMGHSSLNYTAYYIHLVPELLKYSNLTDWHCSLEVPFYED